MQTVAQESSEDEVIVPSSQRRIRHKPLDKNDIVRSSPTTNSSKLKRRLRRPVNTTDNDVFSISDSVEEVTCPRRQLKRKAEHSPVVPSESDTLEEPVISSSTKRRRRAQSSEPPQTPRLGAAQDKLDIEEDIRDLQGSGTMLIHLTARTVFANIFSSCEKQSDPWQTC